jgi:hypothetical protein
MGKAIKKLIILILIFIAAVAVILWINREDEAKREYMVMGEAGLPVIGMIYGDLVINELHGYTEELEVGAIRETIYPLGEERRIPVQIQTRGRQVTKVGYEVRSLDGSHLIERNETTDVVETADGILTAEIALMDLMETDEEYQLIFVLYEGKTRLAGYYTRVRAQADTAVAGAVDFALTFSDKTFLEDPDEMIIAQLESKPGADNSSLGHTDIYSSYSHVLWGKLDPVKGSDITVRIHEFDRLMTALELSYSITSRDEAGRTEFYDVNEYYSVRYVNGKYYLMTYEREVDQDFCGEDVVSELGQLELGIVSEDTLPVQSVRNGKRVAFVRENELRCYDGVKNELRTLFTFSGNETDVCSEYGEHSIRIVEVSEEGNVEFLVYGYMNRGPHEGDTGICFYRYLAAEDALEEVFYISSQLNYERIHGEMGKLSYLNSNGLFYLMYEGNVYAIDIEGGEYVKLAQGLRPETLAVDEKRGVVAWQELDENGVGTDIIIYHLDTGERRKIEAPEGELIEMKGFIRQDILYGLIRRQDWEETRHYSAASPIYALEIINADGAVESRYEQKGIYLTDVEIMEDRICFGRQRWTGEAWEALEGDVLFCREENPEEKDSVLKMNSSERRKRVYALDLGLTEETLIVRNCPKLSVKSGTQLVWDDEDKTRSDRYFAYNNGRLEGVFHTASEAIDCVEAAMGVVVDESQRMVWNRGNRGTAAEIVLPITAPVDNPESSDYLELFLRCLGASHIDLSEKTEGENMLQILRRNCERTLVDLEGADLSQLLYYLDEGVPVLGIDSNNEAVLFVGYHEAYGETDLLYYDPVTAAAVEVSLEMAKTWFFASGNRFVSVIP